MIQVSRCPFCDHEVSLSREGEMTKEATATCPHCSRTLSPYALSFRSVASLKWNGGESSSELAIETTASPNSRRDSAARPNLGQFVAPNEFAPTPRLAPEPAKSPLRQLMGIFLGGAVGLMLGYFLLLWIGGPARDFLGVGTHLPAWSVPASFHSYPAEEEQSSNFRWTPSDTNQPGGHRRSGESDMRPQTPPADATAQQNASALNSNGQEPGAESNEEPPAKSRLQLQSPPLEVTADLLNESLVQAEASRLSFAAGNLSDPSARANKQQSYIHLAELAQRLALDHPNNDEAKPAEIEAIREQGLDLLRSLFASDKARQEVAVLGREWLTKPDRPHAGIIIAGEVVGPFEAVTGHAGIKIRLEGDSRVIPVLGPDPLQAPKGKVVVALGTLLRAPGTQIPGYKGTAPEIIWCAELIIPPTTPTQ